MQRAVRHQEASITRILTETGLVALPDGRMMGYAEYGDPGGLPVFGLHGTPGSRLMFRIADDAARQSGIRLIAPDRPGFGISSYHRGRSFASHARDIAALADSLGIERFAVAGISGGGPYAAACAALFPDRVTALALASPMGPVAPGEGAEKIGPGHHVVFRLSPRVPPLLRPLFSVVRFAILHAPFPVYAFLMRRAGRSDRSILCRGDVRRNLLAGVAEGVRPGVKAALQELRLFSRPWDIPFAAIRAPSILWQGTADRNVPPSAAFKLGELIPDCDIHAVPGAGHYWIFDNMEAVLGKLASLAVKSAAREAGDPGRAAPSILH
jgi:pimeloyl-ACP methyl ester carboxylesterase